MVEAPNGEVRSLRFLRALVTTLMVVMIVGFIVLIALLVTRFPSAPDVGLPESVALPDGTVAEAFTATRNWYAVVTQSDQILIYDRETDALVRTIEIVIED